MVIFFPGNHIARNRALNIKQESVSSNKQCRAARQARIIDSRPILLLIAVFQVLLIDIERFTEPLGHRIGI